MSGRAAKVFDQLTNGTRCGAASVWYCVCRYRSDGSPGRSRHHRENDNACRERARSADFLGDEGKTRYANLCAKPRRCRRQGVPRPADSGTASGAKRSDSGVPAARCKVPRDWNFQRTTGSSSRSDLSDRAKIQERLLTVAAMSFAVPA